MEQVPKKKDNAGPLPIRPFGAPENGYTLAAALMFGTDEIIQSVAPGKRKKEEGFMKSALFPVAEII